MILIKFRQNFKQFNKSKLKLHTLFKSLVQKYPIWPEKLQSLRRHFFPIISGRFLFFFNKTILQKYSLDKKKSHLKKKITDKIAKWKIFNKKRKIFTQCRSPDYPFNSNKVEKLFAYSARIVRSISRKNKRRGKYRFKKYINNIFCASATLFCSRQKKQEKKSFIDFQQRA